MARVQRNLKRRIFVTIAGLILVCAAAIALTIRYSAPKPLSEDETLRIQSAIHAIAPGDIHNLKQNRDGSVTAFVSSGLLHKQTVVAVKVGDKWTATVTMIYF